MWLWCSTASEWEFSCTNAVRKQLAEIYVYVSSDLFSPGIVSHFFVPLQPFLKTSQRSPVLYAPVIWWKARHHSAIPVPMGMCKENLLMQPFFCFCSTTKCLDSRHFARGHLGQARGPTVRQIQQDSIDHNPLCFNDAKWHRVPILKVEEKQLIITLTWFFLIVGMWCNGTMGCEWVVWFLQSSAIFNGIGGHA